MISYSNHSIRNFLDYHTMKYFDRWTSKITPKNDFKNFMSFRAQKVDCAIHYCELDRRHYSTASLWMIWNDIISKSTDDSIIVILLFTLYFQFRAQLCDFCVACDNLWSKFKIHWSLTEWIYILILYKHKFEIFILFIFIKLCIEY